MQPIEPYNENKTPGILTVDKHNLDEEWVAQAKTFYDYSVYLTDALDEVNNIKDNMELKKGEIANSIRGNPADYNLYKITESAINEIVFADEDYQKMNKDLREKERLVNILKGAIKGLEHKKDSLLWVTKLFLAKYYAERLPGEIEEFIEDKQDRFRIHELYQEKLKDKKLPKEESNDHSE